MIALPLNLLHIFLEEKSEKLQHANLYYQKFTIIKTEDHSYFNSTTKKPNKLHIQQFPHTFF